MMCYYLSKININLALLKKFCLFAAQASTGRQGVLGPTKIYLAVQPSSSEPTSDTPSNPPPLVPVQSVITQSTPVVNQIPVHNITPVQQVCSET